jgi:hypothetical protein
MSEWVDVQDRGSMTSGWMPRVRVDDKRVGVQNRGADDE